jgi:hypothetical protein
MECASVSLPIVQKQANTLNLLIFQAQTDGQWSTWDPWGPCSAKCGSGTRSRNRYCTNPEPMNGGQYCSGRQIDTQPCFIDCTSTNRIERDIVLFSTSKTCVWKAVGRHGRIGRLVQFLAVSDIKFKRKLP